MASILYRFQTCNIDPALLETVFISDELGPLHNAVATSAHSRLKLIFIARQHTDARY